MMPFKYSRRRALQLLGGLTGGLLLHACNPRNGSNTGVSEEMKLTLGGNLWIGFTPVFIAQEKGFFREQNLNVEFFQFNSTADSSAAFLADKVESVVVVSSEAVSLAARGKDYRTPLVQDLSRGGDGILARSQVDSIKDFQGRRIAVEQGTVSHFFLLEVLKDAGLSEQEIQLVNANPSAAAAAYEAGNVDIAVTYAPYLHQANEQQNDGRIIYDSSQKPTAITDIYAFNTALLEKKPEVVEAFIKGIFNSIAFLEKNPEQGLAIAAPKFEVSPDELGNQLKGIQIPNPEKNLELLSQTQGDLYLGESFNRLADFLVQQDNIDQAPKINNLFETKYIKRILEN